MSAILYTPLCLLSFGLDGYGVSFREKGGHGFAVGCVGGLCKKVLRIDSGFAAEGS